MTPATEQQWRERLREADGEKAIRYDDDHGHQYLIWRDGEIVRLTHPNFADEGRYHGPYGTTDDLFASLVEDGEMELADRSVTPFEPDDGLRADGSGEPDPLEDQREQVREFVDDDVIGYVAGDTEEAVTLCPDCEEEWDDEIPTSGIRDNPHYGDQVPYPECFRCGEVIRP